MDAISDQQVSFIVEKMKLTSEKVRNTPRHYLDAFTINDRRSHDEPTPASEKHSLYKAGQMASELSIVVHIEKLRTEGKLDQRDGKGEFEELRSFQATPKS